jgi:hypothetical protein
MNGSQSSEKTEEKCAGISTSALIHFPKRENKRNKWKFCLRVQGKEMSQRRFNS